MLTRLPLGRTDITAFCMWNCGTATEKGRVFQLELVPTALPHSPRRRRSGIVAFFSLRTGASAFPASPTSQCIEGIVLLTCAFSLTTIVDIARSAVIRLTHNPGTEQPTMFIYKDADTKDHVLSRFSVDLWISHCGINCA